MKTNFFTTCLLACCCALVAGCATKEAAAPASKPAAPVATAPAVPPEELFAKPTAFDRARLDGLHTELEGVVTNLNLSWVAGIGEAAIPTLVRLAGDKTLPAISRNLALVVLGNAEGKAGLYGHPDRRNDLIVPVIFESLGDQDASVREAAAYAARYVRDARLAPGLEALLQDKKGIQEQAVLGLGSNGGPDDVVPIAKLFFTTDNGVFRLSCVHSLAMLSLDHGIDVASILRNNSAVFGEEKQENVRNVTTRFVEFQALRDLVKQLGAANAGARRQASEALRARGRTRIDFDPEADEAVRAQAIQRWRTYLLLDYWRAPKPKPQTPAPGTAPASPVAPQP